MKNNKIPEKRRIEIEKRIDDMHLLIEEEVKRYGFKKIKQILTKTSLFQKDQHILARDSIIEHVHNNSYLTLLSKVFPKSKLSKRIQNHLKGVAFRNKIYNFKKLKDKIKNEKKTGNYFDIEIFKKFSNVLYSNQAGPANTLKDYNDNFIKVLSAAMIKKGIMVKSTRIKILSELIRVFELEDCYCYTKGYWGYKTTIEDIFKCEKVTLNHHCLEYFCPKVDEKHKQCCFDKNYCYKLFNRIEHKVH